MKKKFSKAWNSSKQPRKQRKYIANAPLHLKSKLLSVNLSKELRAKYSKRNIRIRKGDTVKVMRGKFTKKSGNVNKVDIRKNKIYVESINLVKKDGTKVFYPLNPTNLQITQLVIDDKIRKKSLERK